MNPKKSKRKNQKAEIWNNNNIPQKLEVSVIANRDQDVYKMRGKDRVWEREWGRDITWGWGQGPKSSHCEPKEVTSSPLIQEDIFEMKEILEWFEG